MLLSAVSVLVAAQSSSEISEGLMNNPVLFVLTFTIPVDKQAYSVVCTVLCNLTYNNKMCNIKKVKQVIFFSFLAVYLSEITTVTAILVSCSMNATHEDRMFQKIFQKLH